MHSWPETKTTNSTKICGHPYAWQHALGEARVVQRQEELCTNLHVAQNPHTITVGVSEKQEACKHRRTRMHNTSPRGQLDA